MLSAGVSIASAYGWFAINNTLLQGTESHLTSKTRPKTKCPSGGGITSEADRHNMAGKIDEDVSSWTTWIGFWALKKLAGSTSWQGKYVHIHMHVHTYILSWEEVAKLHEEADKEPKWNLTDTQGAPLTCKLSLLQHNFTKLFSTQILLFSSLQSCSFCTVGRLHFLFIVLHPHYDFSQQSFQPIAAISHLSWAAARSWWTAVLIISQVPSIWRSCTIYNKRGSMVRAKELFSLSQNLLLEFSMFNPHILCKKIRNYLLMPTTMQNTVRSRYC